MLGAIATSLSPEHRRGLDASLADEDSATSFSDLKADPGQPNLDNILIAAKRLGFVKGLALPVAACPDLNGPVSRMLRRRVFNETADMGPRAAALAWVAALEAALRASGWQIEARDASKSGWDDGWSS